MPGKRCVARVAPIAHPVKTCADIARRDAISLCLKISFQEAQKK